MNVELGWSLEAEPLSMQVPECRYEPYAFVLYPASDLLNKMTKSDLFVQRTIKFLPRITSNYYLMVPWPWFKVNKMCHSTHSQLY